MQYIEIFPESERGKSNLGWLQSNFSFSFASYYNPKRMGFGTLRVINDDTITPGKGFGKHPHSNMEIITIPLSGGLSHQDSMGNSAVIQAGEVQAMSAGTGILHSEMNMDSYREVELFQIWIQTRQQDIEPQYSQKKFQEADRKNTWQLLAGPDSTGSNVYINQDAYISRSSLDATKTLRYIKKNPENGLYIMNISGEFEIQDYILNYRDALGIIGDDHIEITAKQDSDFFVLEVPMK